MKRKHDERVLKQAQDKGIKILTEYEFTAPYVKKPVICIAGTNGKSTTAVLLCEMLRHSGKKTLLTGHIGRSIFEFLLEEKEYDSLILELDADYFKYSKHFNFAYTILLNITDEKLIERSDSWQTFADHVTLYCDFISATAQHKPIVYNRDCENVCSVISKTKASCVPYSLSFVESDLGGYRHGSVYISGDDMILRDESGREKTFDLDLVKLKGDFNRENLMAAAITAIKCGASEESVNYVINSFAGVEHRLEFVQQKNNVVFYNDARASTVKGLIRSLSSFDRHVILIAGGKDRNENYESLVPYICKKVKSLILLGESKENMNRTIGDCTETFVVGTFEEAVILAYQKSQSGDIILYSPGCLPSEKFTNIEERGKYYKQLIRTF